MRRNNSNSYNADPAAVYEYNCFAEDFNVSYAKEMLKNSIFVDGNSSIFENFKDIAPGEVRTQKITLTNNDSERDEVLHEDNSYRRAGRSMRHSSLPSADGAELCTAVRFRTQGTGTAVQMEDSLMLADLSKGRIGQM